MSAHLVEHHEDIAGSPQECFDAIMDFATYPEWQGAVKRVKVLQAGGDGRGEVVEFHIDAKLKTVRYVLRYGHEEPGRIWWEYVEGDLRSIEGDYVLEDLGDGTTRATYRLAIDPGRFVPGPVRRVLTGQVMKGSVRDVKERVEGARAP